MNISEKAYKYIEGKAIEENAKSIAQAYSDGYRDGYNDREAEISANFKTEKTDYIDLGLPRGTLWASDYERLDGELLYLPYDETKHLNLPTPEQWEELKTCCKWEFLFFSIGDAVYLKRAHCIGPNGNILVFNLTGWIEVEQSSNNFDAFFWIKSTNIYDNPDRNAARIFNRESRRQNAIASNTTVFGGFRLPVRQVK